jgi:hypothetical protein
VKQNEFPCPSGEAQLGHFPPPGPGRDMELARRLGVTQPSPDWSTTAAACDQLIEEMVRRGFLVARCQDTLTGTLGARFYRKDEPAPTSGFITGRDRCDADSAAALVALAEHS